MSSEMQFLVTAVVDGVSIGVFDSKSGGEPLAPETKHRPGGMGPEKASVSLATISTLTLSRVYERARDHELIRSLSQKAGKVLASATEQPLDDNGDAWGQPVTFSGRFLGVKSGNVDSNSNNPRMFEIDIAVEAIA